MRNRCKLILLKKDIPYLIASVIKKQRESLLYEIFISLVFLSVFYPVAMACRLIFSEIEFSFLLLFLGGECGRIVIKLLIHRVAVSPLSLVTDSLTCALVRRAGIILIRDKAIKKKPSQ